MKKKYIYIAILATTTFILTACSEPSVQTSTPGTAQPFISVEKPEMLLSDIEVDGLLEESYGATLTTKTCKASLGTAVERYYAPGGQTTTGVGLTTQQDIAVFAQYYNYYRKRNCLPTIPVANFRYDQCMENRLIWMAEDPSTNPSSAWGHIGSVRSDKVPSRGCDGNLAGGLNNSGATVASKWWTSKGHRTSLYKPTYKKSLSKVCIFFAMTHGGVPNEPSTFTRASAYWGTCPSKPAPKPTPKPTPSSTSTPTAAPSPTPNCATMPMGSVNTVSGKNGLSGKVTGTTTEDISSFAVRYNQIRVENCLPPIPYSNFKYAECSEQRLIWMAEDPSTDPSSAWGHIGTVRSDGLPSVGCDGNLAGGYNNTGATAADKFWNSTAHRTSLYKPGTSITGACIYFAATHGGVPEEPSNYVRMAAYWSSC